MAGGHDLHGGHGAQVEPIIPVDGKVDGYLRMVCVLAALGIVFWSFILSVPETTAAHSDGKAAPGCHETTHSQTTAAPESGSQTSETSNDAHHAGGH